MTLGETRVRTLFNPSASDTVTIIKNESAKLIDLCERLTDGITDPEIIRLVKLAQTHYEDACMWAVKAATA